MQREIAKIDEDLAAVKQNRRETDRERRMSENIATLKRLFPGEGATPALVVFPGP